MNIKEYLLKHDKKNLRYLMSLADKFSILFLALWAIGMLLDDSGLKSFIGTPLSFSLGVWLSCLAYGHFAKRAP